MKIGQLAQATGTQADTIRYYEKQGLLPSPSRTEGNYRVYGAAHVERLAFIRHCRCLDMTLDEIRVLLRFKDAPGASCGEVDALLDGHIGHVVARIRELRALEKELRGLRLQCAPGQAAGDCGILEGLEKAALAHDHGGAVRRPQAHVHGAHRAAPGKPGKRAAS
jgi:Cd(II)/Pb(II)-responsive transcriptional regulator